MVYECIIPSLNYVIVREGIKSILVAGEFVLKELFVAKDSFFGFLQSFVQVSILQKIKNVQLLPIVLDLYYRMPIHYNGLKRWAIYLTQIQM